jgi:hypothetical protein
MMIAVWLAAGDTDQLAGTIKHWVVNPRAVAMISVLA